MAEGWDKVVPAALQRFLLERHGIGEPAAGPDALLRAGEYAGVLALTALAMVCSTVVLPRRRTLPSLTRGTTHSPTVSTPPMPAAMTGPNSRDARNPTKFTSTSRSKVPIQRAPASASTA